MRLTLTPPLTADSAPDPLTVSVHLDDQLLFASRGAAVRVRRQDMPRRVVVTTNQRRRRHVLCNVLCNALRANARRPRGASLIYRFLRQLPFRQSVASPTPRLQQA